MFKKELVYLSLIILFLIPCNKVFAQKKTSNLVQQLDDLEIEKSRSHDQEAIVIYSLKLLELNAKLSRQLVTKGKFTFNSEDNLVKIISRKQIVKLREKEEIDLNLTSLENKEVTKLVYNLSTAIANKEEVRMKSKVKKVADEETEVESYLSFQIKPTKLNWQGNKVFTQLRLKSHTEQDRLIKLNFENWIDQSSSEPIAFLIQKRETKTRDKFRVSLLYLRSTIIDLQQLDNLKRVIFMNNISACNNLFPQQDKKREESKFGLYYGEDEIGVEFNKRRDRVDFYSNLRKKPKDTQYQLRLAYDFFDVNKIAIIIRGDNKLYNKDILRLGLRDKVNLGSNINYHITYYPLNYTLKEGNFAESILGLGLKLSYFNWHLNYQNTYFSLNQETKEEVDLSYQLMPDWQLRLNWQEQNNKLSFGFFWN